MSDHNGSSSTASPWARPRYAGALSGHGIADIDAPVRRIPLDVAALTAWQALQDRARDGYSRSAVTPRPVRT